MNFYIFTTILILILCSTANFAQRPFLGDAGSFILFTSTGAVDNTGISQIIGDIGTDVGAITGFDAPTTVAGNIYLGDATTAKCAINVQAAYNQLYNMAPTSTGHAPAFGSGETLFAGVYSIAGAGSVAGNLTLDAQGDADAVFIFKYAGAFTTSASSTVTLINGTQACNVFWGAEGAIAMAASTSMQGTLIANNGAISMGAGGTLEGRMLSTAGAASIYQSSISLPTDCGSFSLPIQLLSFTGGCDHQNVILKWSTASETNNDFFTVERSKEGRNWQIVGTLTVSGNTTTLRSYSLTDEMSDKKIAYYRLKQTDLDGAFEYGKMVNVKSCGEDAANALVVYPNPSNGAFELLVKSNSGEMGGIEIFNSQGNRIYMSSGFQSKFDISAQAAGVYFMKVQRNAKATDLRVVIN